MSYNTVMWLLQQSGLRTSDGSYMNMTFIELLPTIQPCTAELYCGVKVKNNIPCTQV